MISSALLVHIALFLLQSPVGAVSGRLLLKDGLPSVGVRVSAVAENFPDVIVASALTDDSGNYRLEGIPPGRYYITAGLVDAPSYYPGVIRASEAKLVSVTARGVAPNIDFVMLIPIDVRVGGRVIRQADQDIGPIPILVLVPDPQDSIPISMLQTVIKPDGTFEFPKVRPGTYVAMLPSFPVTPPLRSPIVVIDRNVTGIEIVLPVMVDVTGRVVVDGDRKQVPSFPLLFNRDGRPSSTSVSNDGTLRIFLAEGEYRVSIGALPPGYSVKSFTAGKTNLLQEPLRLKKGTSVEIVVSLVSD